MTSACCSAGQKNSTFHRASSLLSELKAFSASISGTVSQNRSSSCGYHNLAYAELSIFPRTSRSYFIDWVIVLQIIGFRTLPIPIGLNPEVFSRGIRRHKLYAVRNSSGRTFACYCIVALCNFFAKLNGCLVEVS